MKSSMKAGGYLPALLLAALGGCSRLDPCSAFGGGLISSGLDAVTHPVQTVTHPLQAATNVAFSATGSGLHGEEGTCQGSGNGNPWSCAACTSRCCGKYHNSHTFTQNFGECVTQPLANGIANLRTAPQVCYTPFCVPDCPAVSCDSVTCTYVAGIDRQMDAYLADVYRIGANPSQAMFQGSASRDAFLGANSCCITRPAHADDRQRAGGSAAGFGEGTNKLVLPHLDAGHAFAVAREIQNNPQHGLHTDGYVYVKQCADDTCRYYNDGECDEPRYCNSGTDCSDCGNCGDLVGGSGHRRQMQRQTDSAANAANVAPGSYGLIEVLAADEHSVDNLNILVNNLRNNGR